MKALPISRTARFIGAPIVALLTACSAPQEPPSRISMLPSLRPVDAARPMVVFGQIRGEACGNDAVAGAIRNLERLSQVDGYLEVVLEETGVDAGRCARVTAFPFRYGSSTDLPALVASATSPAPVVVAGRARFLVPSPSDSAPPVFDCTGACQKLAALTTAASIEQALTKERCITRCSKPDSAFQSCITGAKDQPTAKACLTP